jgi:hypothetical protein
MATKEQTIRIHAKRRFDERYGINLTESLHQELVAFIQSGQPEDFICAQSNRVSVWAVSIAEQYTPKGQGAQRVPVAYDKVRKLLVTALPVACLDPNKVGLFTEDGML